MQCAPNAACADAAGLSLADVIHKDAFMAVLVQLTVTPATQQQFNELDAAVGQSMTDAGGPPDGLMSHVVYPDGVGFVVAEVWRTESKAPADRRAKPGRTSSRYCCPYRSRQWPTGWACGCWSAAGWSR